jgi:hypothetical protein
MSGKQDHGDLPVDTLQLWDCLGYQFTIVEKLVLRNLGVKFLAPVATAPFVSQRP